MIRIAFVEDDLATVQTTKGNLDRYAVGKDIHLQADHYPRAETLLDGYAPRYELILLDVHLEGGITGMEAAQEIRKLDMAVCVIQHSEDVNLMVPTTRGVKVLPSREITFLEVSDHELVYHTESGECRARGSLGKVEEQLLGRSFMRTAVSHLANLRYVSEIDGNTLILTTGDRLPISRARKKTYWSDWPSIWEGRSDVCVHIANVSIMAEVLLAEHLFARFLVRKERYPLRLMISCAACLLIAFFRCHRGRCCHHRPLWHLYVWYSV